MHLHSLATILQPSRLQSACTRLRSPALACTRLHSPLCVRRLSVSEHSCKLCPVQVGAFTLLYNGLLQIGVVLEDPFGTDVSQPGAALPLSIISRSLSLHRSPALNLRP